MTQSNPKQRNPELTEVHFRRIPGRGYRIPETDQELTIDTILKYSHEIKGNRGVLWVPQTDLIEVTGGHL